MLFIGIELVAVSAFGVFSFILLAKLLDVLQGFYCIHGC